MNELPHYNRIISFIGLDMLASLETKDAKRDQTDIRWKHPPSE